ncbi:MAG: leucine-rich repeat protein [Oscillospiraceae bacterium]
MKRIEGKRCLSFLLALVMVLGLLPTGLFTIEARAADYDGYDSDVSHFGYTVVTNEDPKKDYLTVERYTGSATAVRIPNEVTVAELVELGKLTTAQQTTYTSAGVAALPVKAVTRFLINSTNGDSIQKICVDTNVTTLNDRAFAGSSKGTDLREIDFISGSQLEKIYGYAFSNPGLERVGVDGTDRMPSGLTLVAGYSFYQTYNLRSIDLSAATNLTDISECAFADSGIASVQLPNSLTGIGDSAFSDCRNLTSISFPAGITYFGPRVLKNCTSMTEVILKFKIYSGVTVYNDALTGLNRDCTIWVPQPDTQANYTETIRRIYETMCASGAVELRWLDSSGNKTSISPKTTPTASTGIVTLTGEDAGDYSFTYDPTDADGDGLGGILYLEGSSADVQLQINTGYAGNYTTTKWTWGQAYVDNRRGTQDYDALRGTELTEDMRRTETLNKAYNYKDGTTVSLQSSSNPQGLYYYFPRLINENTNYVNTTGSNGRPQSAADLPPVLVVYKPAVEHVTVTSAPSATTSNLRLDQCEEKGDYSCDLTNGSKLVIRGIDAWLEDYNAPLVSGETPAQGSNRALTYTWYRSDDGTTTGGTVVASGTAVYDSYEKTTGSGIYWRCPGPSESYIAGLSAGTYQYYLQVTAKDNEKGTSEVIFTSPELYTLNLYNTVKITGFTFDAADAADPANDFKAGSDDFNFTMRKGARNVVIRPTITGIDALDCTVEYKWSGAADGVTRTSSYFLSDWLRQDYGSASVYCYVYVYNNKGAQIASASASFKVAYERDGSTYTPAAAYASEPIFDTEAQSQPQYVGKNGKGKDTIYAYMAANARGTESTVSSILYLDGATYELYLAPSASDNRGGTLIGSSTQIVSQGAYTADGNGGYQGTFYFQFAAYEFPDYGVYYCYIKATNPDGSVAYSPVFPVIPTNNVASTATRPAERSVTVTSMPYSNLYVAEGDTASLTVGLELKNVPLAESVTAYNSKGFATSVFSWQPYTSSSYGTIGSYNDVSAEYIVDELEVKGNEYTIRGRAILTVNNDTSLSGRLLASSTYADTDGGIMVRLKIDKEKFASTTDTADPDPTLLPFKLYSAAEGTVPEFAYQTATGGKEYVGWGKNEEGVYGYIFKDGSGLIPDDEFWLYSDRYDGKNAENNFNSPGSETAVVLEASMQQQSGNSGMIVWKIENSAYPDDPAYNVRISDDGADAPYDTGSASSDGKWPAFTDTLTVGVVSVSDSAGKTSRTSQLTVSVPHGTKAMTLKITPLAVQTNSDGTWQAVAPGETYTIRINPVESATDPTVYLNGSNALYLHPTGSAGTVLSGYATTPDSGTLTLQWYRSSDVSTDPSADTPVGNTFTGTGSVDATYTLTAEELAALGNTTVYYYLYAENYNRAALNNQRASDTSRAITVAISSGYKFLQSSDVLSSYTGGTQTLAVGQEPQGDPFTLVMAAPATSMSQYVSYEVTYYKAGTTQVLESSTGQLPTIVCDGSDNLSQTSDGSGTGFTATISDDKTKVTYSVPYDMLLRSTRGYSENRTADYDMEFHWVITEYYSGDTGYYATGGNKATAETAPFTLQQRRESKPAITSIAVDSTAQVTDIPKESYPTGLVTALESIPAFQQATGSSSYMRPITYTPVLTGETENRVLNVKLQYFNTTIDEETGEAIGWTDISYGSGAAYFPDGSGGYTSAYYNGYEGAVSGQPTTVCLLDNGVAFNKDDSVLFLRLAVRTRYGGDDNSASDPCYSDPVALVRYTGTVVNAGTPQYSGSDKFYPANYYWNNGTGGEESHTFGAEKAFWSVTEEEGVPAGELTFQWEWWNTSAGTWVTIAGATDAACTVDKATLQSWVDANGEDTVKIRLRAINTNNASAITGKRTGEYDKYTDIHFVQAANVPAGLTITGTPVKPIAAGSTDTNLTVNIGNSSDMKSLSYKWEIRVTEATPDGGSPVSNPFDSSYAYQWDAVGTTQTLTVPTTGSVTVKVPQSDGGMQTWNMNDLWTAYDAIKVELRCTVTNTDSSIADANAQTVTATVYSDTFSIQIPQTIKDQHITAADKDGNTSTTITDDTDITLTAPEIAGVSYQWCRTNPEGDVVSTVSGATDRTLTVTASAYSNSYPNYLCKLIDTATGISRYTDSIQLGTSLSGSAAAPIVTVKKYVYVCDPNGLDAVARFDLDAEVADGGMLTYQWEQYIGGKWTVLAGETNDYLALADRDDEVGYYEYRCTITNTKDEYTASVTRSFRLTVRGIVLTRDDSLNPVAGKNFSTGFTLRAYGLSGCKLTWSIPAEVTAYTLEKSETYVSGSDGSIPLANTLTAAAAETASFNLTVTTGYVNVWNTNGTSSDREMVTRTYTVILPVDLTAEPFGIATRKFTATLDQPFEEQLTIDGGSYTAESWAWSGDVPDGLSLSADGKITGTPTVPGRYAVDVTVTATDKTAVTNTVTIIVKSPAGSTGNTLNLTVDGTQYSSAQTTDYSGPGWDWSYEAGVLTLDGYSGGKIQFYSYSSTGGAYIRVKGDSTVTASGSGNIALSSDGPGTLYLYGDKDLTVSSGYHGIYAGSGLDLSRYKGDLTVTAQGDGTGNVAGIWGNVTGAGAQGSLTVTAKNGDAVYGVKGNLACSGSHAVTINGSGSVQSVFGVNNALTAEGTGAVAVNVTASGTACYIYGVNSNVTANQSSGGTLTITVNTSADPGAGEYYVWGVYNTLTQSGTGAVQVTVTQTSPGTIRYVYGVRQLTVENSGTVVVKADGGGTASAASGAYTTATTTGGIGSVSLKGVNAEHATGAGAIPSLQHTNGSITFEGDTYGLRQGPADVSWFLVTGSPGSTSVKYTAPSSKTPKFTVDGVAQDTDYNLYLQNGQAMTPITIAAYANGGCTVTLTSDLPAGLSWNSSTGVLSGTPTVSGSGTITFTATNLSSSDSKTFTVKWNSNNLLLKYGGYNTLYYNTGNVQVNQGATTYPIRLYSVGDRPTSWSITVDGVLWEGTLSDNGGGAALKPAAGAGDSYTASGYWTFNYDASGKDVGDTVKIIATPLNSDDDAIGELTFYLEIVPANTPQWLAIGAAYLYDPGVHDGSGTGWSWSKSALTLTLDGYNGAGIYVNDSNICDLTVSLTGDNTITTSGYTTGLGARNVTLEGSGSLTLNCEASTMRGIKADSVTVEGGSLSVIMAAGNEMWVGANAVGRTLNIGAGAQSVLLQCSEDYTGTANAAVTVNKPSGVAHYEYTSDLLYAYGTALPTPVVTIDGPDTVTVGTAVDLVANIQPWMAGMKVYNASGTEVAGTYTYLWENKVDGGFSYNQKTLNRPASEIGSVNAYGQYFCTVTYANAALGSGTTKGTSDPHTLTVVAAGVTVSGKVKSYNPGNATTIQLKQGEEVKYTTTIAAETGNGQKEQTFSFATVAAGTYDLVVIKPGHLTYTIKNVVVGSTDIDLTSAAYDGKAYQMITLLAGDINGDGTINLDDFVQIQANFMKSGTLSADITGDSVVNLDDFVQVQTNFMKSSSQCIIAY